MSCVKTLQSLVLNKIQSFFLNKCSSDCYLLISRILKKFRTIFDSALDTFIEEQTLEVLILPL